MIKTFADKQTQQLYLTGKACRVPPEVAKRAARKLEQVNAAARVEDLEVPPGNRLEALKGNRKGQLQRGLIHGGLSAHSNLKTTM